ncbi:MAG: YkgJ family cysteine cluster protein [Phycisphaerales bacterium]|nr:YkgJ family cysteine cluster protein [Phycisphaerales bacterium]
MKLPVIIPEIRSQAWSCHGCTKCCRELIVHLTRDDQKRIDQQQWRSKLGVAPYVKHPTGIVLNHNPGQGCVFLLPDGKCRIHAELGMDAKPFACKIYPFTLEREGDAVRVGLRFDCPTVTKSDGNPLPSHRRELQALSDKIGKDLPALYRPDPEAIAFSAALSIDRGTLDRIVGRFDKWIGDNRRSINDRISGLVSVVSILNNADAQKFDGPRLAELIDMLVNDLPAGAADGGAPILEPSRSQLKLLRQAAFAYGSFIRFDESRMGLWKSMRFRLAQLRHARNMTAGSGRIPSLACDDIVATFENLRAVRPIAPENSRDADELLTRYLQARIANRGAFGRHYYGWPVLAGLNATLLALAVIGWFARRSAAGAGRDRLSTQDVRDALMIVDRSAGRSPELGARSSRLRLRYLTQENGLQRLIAHHAIVSDA